jgi:hypothetical protein
MQELRNALGLRWIFGRMLAGFTLHAAIITREARPGNSDLRPEAV